MPFLHVSTLFGVELSSTAVYPNRVLKTGMGCGILRYPTYATHMMYLPDLINVRANRVQKQYSTQQECSVPQLQPAISHLDDVSEGHEGGMQNLLVHLLLQPPHVHIPLWLRLFGRHLSRVRECFAHTRSLARPHTAQQRKTAIVGYQGCSLLAMTERRQTPGCTAAPSGNFFRQPQTLIPATKYHVSFSLRSPSVPLSCSSTPAV